MTKSEMSRLRKVLEANVTEFDGSARRRDALLIEASGDEIDRVQGAAERELAVRNLEAVSRRLREARAALQRLQDRTYGVCLECEQTISRARLAALPWAARCVRCQEATDCRCEA